MNCSKAALSCASGLGTALFLLLSFVHISSAQSPPVPDRPRLIQFESPSHHDCFLGVRAVTGYEVGVRTRGSKSLLRVRSVGLPAADPDGLVRVPISDVLADLPNGEFELAVRTVGRDSRSEWSSFTPFKIGK